MEKEIQKVVRNGKVAVLISGGFGAGWSTWNDNEDILLFHPKLVEMVESGRKKEITEEYMEKEFGIEGVYCGGAGKLSINWVNQGESFSIDEYDGSESLVTRESLTRIA